MNRSEFDDWIDMHCARFSGVSNMIENDPTISNDWFSRIGHATVDQATEATREIMAMDPQPFPSDHLGKLASIIKSLRFIEFESDRFTPKVESYRCLQCFDRGAVYVFHPLAYSEIRNGTFDKSKHVNEIVVACYCDAGKIHQQPKTKTSCHPLMQFDANRMLPTHEQTADDLVEFVNDRYRPRNYHEEFADFGA